MRRLILCFIAVLLLTAGCDFFDRQKREEAEKAEAALQSAVAETRDAGEALAADQEHVFRPTAEQAAYLETFTARSADDTPNGFFTNQDGLSGYFQGYDRPFNFLWTGGTAEVTAFDGRVYRVMDGPGELLLKYQDDALLLQRSKGEFKDGLWHGYGELWNRNRDAGGHNYLYYRGEFSGDHMTGRGVYINYNFTGRGSHPYKYEGEMKDDQFHGQGTLTDLATGEMDYKGLWMEDRRFSGSLEDWRAGDRWRELNSVERQYRDVFMTGNLRLDSSFINVKPGEGVLAVVVPDAFENVELGDQAGRSYPVGLFMHPDENISVNGEEPAKGAVIEAQLSAYPLTLTLGYDLGGKRHHFRVTVKRPFVLVLEDADLDEKPVAAKISGSETPDKDELERQLKNLIQEFENKK